MSVIKRKLMMGDDDMGRWRMRGRGPWGTCAPGLGVRGCGLGSLTGAEAPLGEEVEGPAVLPGRWVRERRQRVLFCTRKRVKNTQK